MTTAYLTPTQPLAEERRRPIAEHQKEANRLIELARSLWNAVALERRLQETTDPQLRAALEHNCAEYKRWHHDVDERAIEQPHAQG